jgi:hypothetical protein
MFEATPEVMSLLAELEADPNAVSLTFFPMGIHTHIMSDGQGGWNLEVHTTVENEGDMEAVISDDRNLPTEVLVTRMSMLALIANVYVDEQVQQFSADDADAELAALLGEN